LQLSGLWDIGCWEKLAVLEELGLHGFDALLESCLLGLEGVDFLTLALT